MPEIILRGLTGRQAQGYFLVYSIVVLKAPSVSDRPPPFPHDRVNAASSPDFTPDFWGSKTV